MTSLNMPILRRASAEDWDAVRDLLRASDLPTEDLGPDRLDGFLIAEDDGVIVGLIGLELLGDVGLLRSLVVEKKARRAGLGSKLVGALESAAETAGVTELWLLTIDAQDFFQRHNYEIVSRETAPESVRGSEEFSALCPDTAYLMCKSLG
ncbi:MAG: arsenic resistance N-acetyltransferase ArsN2 [Woeseiaceae bacterium]|nr:arsenic resistance N-acetyltransferase ArsN2 [Woeseiaceae bacterium]